MHGAPLYKHLALRVEQKHTEGAMQLHVTRSGLHTMAVSLAGSADGLVVLVDQNAFLFEGVRLQRIVDFGVCLFRLAQ